MTQIAEYNEPLEQMNGVIICGLSEKSNQCLVTNQSLLLLALCERGWTCGDDILFLVLLSARQSNGISDYIIPQGLQVHIVEDNIGSITLAYVWQTKIVFLYDLRRLGEPSCTDRP